jgi:hypothetical protein
MSQTKAYEEQKEMKWNFSNVALVQQKMDHIPFACTSLFIVLKEIKTIKFSLFPAIL